MYTHTHRSLISVAQLAPHIADPDWLRPRLPFRPRKTRWGERFTRGHVPNALYAHLDRDLSAVSLPAPGGIRCPQPEASRPPRRAGESTRKRRSWPTTQGPAAYASRCGGCCVGSGTRASRSSTAVSPRGHRLDYQFRRPRRRAATRRAPPARITTATCGSTRRVAERGTARRMRSSMRAQLIGSPGQIETSIPSRATSPEPAIIRSRAISDDGRFLPVPTLRLPLAGMRASSQSHDCHVRLRRDGVPHLLLAMEQPASGRPAVRGIME